MSDPFVEIRKMITEHMTVFNRFINRLDELSKQRESIDNEARTIAEQLKSTMSVRHSPTSTTETKQPISRSKLSMRDMVLIVLSHNVAWLSVGEIEKQIHKYEVKLKSKTMSAALASALVALRKKGWVHAHGYGGKAPTRANKPFTYEVTTSGKMQAKGLVERYGIRRPTDTVTIAGRIGDLPIPCTGINGQPAGR